MNDLIAQIGVFVVFIVSTLGYVFLRGRDSAKKAAEFKELSERAEAAAKNAEFNRETTNVVATTRNDVAVTPGASGESVATEVRTALEKSPNSLQGRLGAMSRDRPVDTDERTEKW